MLVLASGNPGKLRELKAMLEPLGWSVMPQNDWEISEAVEDGLGFIENALIKARHASRHAGLPALGDDSGLVVDALSGAPGIYSSRFAGVDADESANNHKLLSTLKGVPEPARGSHFYCARALVRHSEDPSSLLPTGIWEAQIMNMRAGAGGLDYSPCFP